MGWYGTRIFGLEESKGPPQGSPGGHVPRGLISFGKRKLIKYAATVLSERVSPSLSISTVLSLSRCVLHSLGDK